MKDFLKKGLETFQSGADKVLDEVTSGYSLVKDKVNGLPIFVSLETSKQEQKIQYDEKHYFVIPYHLSEYQFALHTMRCLPDGVPDINQLPKRRVFHFANEHGEYMLKHYMQQSAMDIVHQQNQDKPNNLESLANHIDALDKKLTMGMLLVGGLTALVNPIAGIGIAAKALTPGVGSLVNQFALKPGAKKLQQHQLDKSLKEAQSSIENQFEEASTLKVINPILQELELALATNEEQHDPLLGPNLGDGSISELDHQRWRNLTEIGICHVYKEAYENPKLHEKAQLGPEDLRWLSVLYEVHTPKKH